MCEKLSLIKRIKSIFTGGAYGNCKDVIAKKDSIIEKLTNKLDKSYTKLNIANDEYVVIKNQYADLDSVFKEKVKLLKEKDKVIKDYVSSINKLKNELTLVQNELKRTQSENKAIVIENDGLIAKLKACNVKLAQTLKEITEKSKKLEDNKCIPKKRNTKLTCEEIKEARTLHDNGDTITDIASMMGVSDSTLSRAINCVTYKHCCEKKKK